LRLNFIKMHGLGNDFILVDCVNQRINTFRLDLKMLSVNLCDRRFGIGADQLILLEKSKIADFKMRIFNKDGSEVEMCGNGIRCLAKYVWDNKLSNKDTLDIETLAGLIRPQKVNDMVKVDMGEPIFKAEMIPVDLKKWSLKEKISDLLKRYKDKGVVLDFPITVKNKIFKVTCVSMGNPHAVIYVKDLKKFPVTEIGPIIENYIYFPKKTNVEFVKVLNDNEVEMRVWERGAGETLACGTGASATAVVSHLKRLTSRRVKVRLLGGELFIEWGDDNHVYMTGPATKVFTGYIDVSI
jgi:diaminopimelate epimerase